MTSPCSWASSSSSNSPRSSTATSRAHPLHQGLSNGWLITVWIAYILSRADHRKSPVQAWAEELQHTLETLIGQTIRPVEFSDDRLTLLLKRLDDPAGLGVPGSRPLAHPL